MKAIASVVIVGGLLAAAPQQAPRPPGGVPLESRRLTQPAGAGPIEVLSVEKAWGGARDLMPLTLSDDAAIRNAAVRALGRLEDPRLVLPLLALKNISAAARADALAQSLKGFDAAVDPSLVQTALEWLHGIGSRPLSSDPVALAGIAVVMVPLGRITYATPEQMHKAEDILLRITVFARPDPRLSGVYLTGLRAFESLARVNTRVSGLEEETIAQLEKAVEKQSLNDSATARFLALAALINGRGLDADTLKVALNDDDWEVRRLAMTVLGGSGAGLDDATRVKLIEEALDDKSANVRYEALRAYTRRGARTSGCGPILSALTDRDPHVAVAALDALGDLCKDDEEVTTRVMAEARTPPAVGSWHRETHAFVALAKRSPQKAATSMEAFVTHPVWWVRMYAAGAAAVAGDLIHLDKLAYDAHDNVREAAIEPLRRLKKADAEPAIVAALDRTDVQLLRTAARLLKESPARPTLFRPLFTALLRLTKEGKDTSRDTRLALLEAVGVHAARDDATELVPLLRDFDPKIAEKAAQIVIERSGRAALPAAVPPARGWPQEFSNLRQCVTVELAGGGSFRMNMLPASAPIAVDRFLKLATRDRYYDGLSIHRVVPNFVIQGGSPGANEYAGHKEYMRDEVGGSNVRGSVGLSTRGRNTGDAQFFVNLVNNPRLDYDYTVFATVFAEDMDVVDRIQEGDVMRSINLGKCPR
jgi:cyclophilin family peptidyl-prolyl cis-trans isomerase/HEAT repeat protein